MNINQLYHIPVSVEVEQNFYPSSQALAYLYSHFFEGANQKRLFYYLTQVQQKTESILMRQETLRDVTNRGAKSFFKFGSSMNELSQEVRSREMVKVWKTIKQSGGYPDKREPLVYNHAALADCVSRFQEKCREVLAGLSKTQSDTFSLIKSHLAQFVGESDLSRSWDRERVILSASQSPFFGMVEQDPWTHEVAGIQPVGSFLPEDSVRLKIFVSSAIRSGAKTMTIKIGTEELKLEFVDFPDGLPAPKYESEKNPKRYLDFDLFHNARAIIPETAKIWKHMELYRHSMLMHDKLKRDKLPVCLPQPSSGVLNLQDFYPLHCRLPAKEYVKNSIRLDPTSPIALVTGLNAAGKSSLLHTLSVICELHNAGFYVPAKSAEIPYFESVSLQTIIRENIERGQSTFAAQVDGAKRLLEEHHDGGLKLLMIDEATSGTDSASHKRAILEIMKILSQVIKKPTIIVSHSTEAAEEVQANAGDYPGVQLLCFKKGRNPRKLVPGIGPSEGVDILNEAGLTLEDFLERKK